MGIAITNEQNYSNIAAAIRNKLGVQTQYKPSEMAAAVSSISGGGLGTAHDFTAVDGSQTLSSNGKLTNMTFSFNSADYPNAKYYFISLGAAAYVSGAGILDVPYSGFVVLNSALQTVASFATKTGGGTVNGLNVANFLGTITISTTQNFSAADYKWRWIGCWFD